MPDVVVAPTAVLESNVALLDPRDVLLAVELVSPGSRTTDRVTKPAQYAGAGIPAYWRVEQEPQVTLTAYVLESGTGRYREIGTWGPGEVAESAHPFQVRIEVDALIRSGAG